MFRSQAVVPEGQAGHVDAAAGAGRGGARQEGGGPGLGARLHHQQDQHRLLHLPPDLRLPPQHHQAQTQAQDSNSETSQSWNIRLVGCVKFNLKLRTDIVKFLLLS